MADYRFIGTETEVDHGRIKLDSFGQKVSLDDATAKTVILGGGAIIPEAEYQAAGITADEEKKYRYAGARATAPESFKQKLKKVLDVFHRLRHEHATATKSAPVTPAPAPVAPVAPAAPVKTETEVK